MVSTFIFKSIIFQKKKKTHDIFQHSVNGNLKLNLNS